MNHTDSLGRLGQLGRRTTTVALSLLVAATGTVAAHGGGGYGGGGMMGGGVTGGGMGGVFGGTMGLLGILWMALLVAIPLYLGYVLLRRESGDGDTGAIDVLRDRYARGDLSEEEFERRRAVIERSG